MDDKFKESALWVIRKYELPLYPCERTINTILCKTPDFRDKSYQDVYNVVMALYNEQCETMLAAVKNFTTACKELKKQVLRTPLTLDEYMATRDLVNSWLAEVVFL